MFEIISTVIDILIAAVATIIAVIELRNDRKRKQEEYAKNVTLKELVSKINNASLSLDALQSINEMPVYSEDDVYRSSEMCAEFIKQYMNFYTPIVELYKGLLKFESEFSLSYGFERYIIYFREYIRQTQTGHKEIVKHYDYLLEDTKNKDYNGCIVDCGQLTDKMKLQMATIKTLDPLIITELKYKFSIEDKAQN